MIDVDLSSTQTIPLVRVFVPCLDIVDRNVKLHSNSYIYGLKKGSRGHTVALTGTVIS